MRIATSQFFQQSVRELNRHQASLTEIQEQIASGKRLLKPSDDPAAAARVLDLSQGIERLVQFKENAGFADQRLGLEEATLTRVTNLIQRVREVALQSNSGAQSNGDRAAYRAEIEQRLAELVDYANAKDANGEYLFAGFKGDTQPFTVSGGSVIYNGDQGQPFLQVGASRQVASGDSGYEVFQRIKNGNGTFVVSANGSNTGNGVIASGSVIDPSAYQPNDFTIRFTSDTTFDVIDDTTATTILSGQPFVEGDAIGFNGIETRINGTPQAGDEFTIAPSKNQDIFTTLQNFISAMGSNPTTGAEKAQLNQVMNGVIDDLDNALNHVLNVRTSVGARQNSLASIEQENDSIRVQLQGIRSDTEDLDLAEAVSKLQFRMTTLQALQQSFAKIQGLSLFNFLR